ncbi:hypothetical protein BC827DRAFT_1371278 [Russula dissimulans]|nr:hypothetical protein BC827DRAFT_1371278 [Russula dissimulans]
MIVDIPITTMRTDAPIPAENPPAYSTISSAPPPGKGANLQNTPPKPLPLMLAGNAQVVYGATSSSEARVYHYQDPRTGLWVASLLPPDHPQMVCLQTGAHVPETRYGCLGASHFSYSLLTVSRLTFAVGVLLGVLAAIIWFPLGIGLCLLDRRVRCERCGESIEEGLCS